MYANRRITSIPTRKPCSAESVPVCKRLFGALRCGPMYEVYSQTRPGRPRWAVAACALLLLLTLALAAMISTHKSRGTRVSLTREPELFPAGRLRIRMPVDWNRDKGSLSGVPGVVTEARRVAGGIAAAAQATRERVIVFRSPPRRNGIPSIDAAESLRRQLGTETMIESRSEPTRMGSLPAWSVEYAPDSRGATTSIHCLGKAALAPDGQIAGLVLICPRPPTEEDRRLLENMGNSLELTDLEATDQPAQVMKAAGITFMPPADARFFVATSSKPLPLPRVRLVGGEGRKTWYLEATRVPLVGGRKAAELVETHAQTLLEQTVLPSPPEIHVLGDRATAQLTLALPENAKPTLLLMGAEVDEQTGLLIIGRHEEEGEETLRAAAEAVAAGSIESIATLVDIPEAQANARRYLREISAEGLGTFWANRAVETSQLQAPLFPARQEVRSYQAISDTGDQSRWWQIKTAWLSPGPSARMAVDIQEEWRIRDDGASHGGLLVEKRGSRQALEYRERRLAGANEVVCHLGTTEAEPVSWSVPTDDTYGCEPVLIAAGARLVRDAEARPALFASTEKYSQLPARWLMIPLGEWPTPNPESTRTAPAICLIRDSDPMPIVLYYGQDDSVVAISYDNIIWQERINAGAGPRPSPTPRKRTR